MLCAEIIIKGISAMTNTARNQPENDSFAQHQRWGGTYLVVADESEEFQIALRYATRMANANKCRLGIVYVMESQGFTHWGNIEKRIHDEQRQQAERVLNEACFEISERGGEIPALYLEEGGRIEALSNAIENDPGVSMLILAGGTQGSGPGPLVSYFTGKGLSKLRVPVIVVPDHLGL